MQGVEYVPTYETPLEIETNTYVTDAGTRTVIVRLGYNWLNTSSAETFYGWPIIKRVFPDAFARRSHLGEAFMTHTAWVVLKVGSGFHAL